MGYTVLRIEKRKAVQLPLGQHIERGSITAVETSEEIQIDDSQPDVQEDVIKQPFFPDNADPERTKLNKELIERPLFRHPKTKKMMVCSIEQAIRRRIKKAGVTDIRSNQNIALEVIMSGSNETLNAMTSESIDQWAEDSVSWAQDTWGKENVVSATLHMDEKTPHIHMFVVPIVYGPNRDSIRKRRKALEKKKKELSEEEYAKRLEEIAKYEQMDDLVRLCADEICKPRNFRKLQTAYAKEVGAKYGLERGVEAEPGCHVNHTSSIEYNRQLKCETMELEKRKESLQEQTGEMVAQKDSIQASIRDGSEQLKSLQDEIAASKSQMETMQKEMARLKQTRNNLLEQNRQLKDDRNALEIGIKGLIERIQPLREKLRSFDALVQGVRNEKAVLMIPKICSRVLRQIVADYLVGEFKGYAEMKGGGYGFVLKPENGSDIQYHINPDGYVFHYDKPVMRRDGTQLQMPEFIDFFKVVPRQFVYDQLEANLRKKISAKSAVRKKGPQHQVKL